MLGADQLAQIFTARGFITAPLVGDIGRFKQWPFAGLHGAALFICNAGLLLDRIKQNFADNFCRIPGFVEHRHSDQGL